MKELNSTEQEGLSISAYWSPRSRDEMPIGYGGITKRFILYQCLGLILVFSSKFVKLPIGSRFRAMNPWLLLSLTLFTILLSFLPGRQKKEMMGFYQLDEHGVPTHYIGSYPPVSIRGHMGLNRKNFLQSLG